MFILAEEISIELEKRPKDTRTYLFGSVTVALDHSYCVK